MILTLLTSTFSAFGAQKMVFLVEGPDGRHVGSSLDYKNFKFETKGENWHLYPAISTDASSIAYVQGTGPRDLGLVVETNGNKQNGFSFNFFGYLEILSHERG